MGAFRLLLGSLHCMGLYLQLSVSTARQAEHADVGNHISGHGRSNSSPPPLPSPPSPLSFLLSLSIHILFEICMCQCRSTPITRSLRIISRERTCCVKVMPAARARGRHLKQRVHARALTEAGWCCATVCECCSLSLSVIMCCCWRCCCFPNQLWKNEEEEGFYFIYFFGLFVW